MEPSYSRLSSTSRAGSTCSHSPCLQLIMHTGTLLSPGCLRLSHCYEERKATFVRNQVWGSASNLCSLLGACFPFSFFPALLDSQCSPRAASSQLGTVSISHAALTECSGLGGPSSGHLFSPFCRLEAGDGGVSRAGSL